MKTVILSGCLLISVSVQAEVDSFRVFTPGSIKKLLGPYPAAGSQEEMHDFAVLRHYQETRTEQDCELAEKQENPTVKNLFVANNGPLTKKEATKVTPLILKAYAEAGVNIYLAKSIYKRPRPYIYNNEIRPCIRIEKGYAYPSGHTAISRVLAHALAKFYPARAQAFLNRADEVALNRVIGGVHHPSDIVAGKKLGDAIAIKVLEKLK